MALAAMGVFIVRGTISTNTDTVVIAAPGTSSISQQIQILWITLTVSVGGTTSRLIVQAGTGGATILRMSTLVADALLHVKYTTQNMNPPGNTIGVNTALSINTTGGAAATVDYEVCYRLVGN